jgi:hypothetical protein
MDFDMIGCVRLGSIARHGLQPRRLKAELEWELEVQDHKGWNDPVSDGCLADRPKLGEG